MAARGVGDSEVSGNVKECLEGQAKLSARIDDLCDALVKEAPRYVEMRFGSQKKTTGKNEYFFFGGYRVQKCQGIMIFLVIIEHKNDVDNHIKLKPANWLPPSPQLKTLFSLISMNWLWTIWLFPKIGVGPPNHQF